MARKERVTVTVDAELVEAGNRAVKAGQADSLSSWVNDALAEREVRHRRLRGMADAIAAYESEHGSSRKTSSSRRSGSTRRRRSSFEDDPGAGLKPRGRRRKAA